MGGGFWQWSGEGESCGQLQMMQSLRRQRKSWPTFTISTNRVLESFGTGVAGGKTRAGVGTNTLTGREGKELVASAALERRDPGMSDRERVRWMVEDLS